MNDFLKGRKTYISGALLVVFGLAKAVLPQFGIDIEMIDGDPVTMIGTGVVALTLRKGIKDDTSQ